MFLSGSSRRVFADVARLSALLGPLLLLARPVDQPLPGAGHRPRTPSRAAAFARSRSTTYAAKPPPNSAGLVGELVELEHLVGDPLEECPVVRDDQQRAVAAEPGRPPGGPGPSTSRSLVGSSSSRTSTWLSRIAASAARASSPPESVAVACGQLLGVESEAGEHARRPALEVRPADREVVVESSRIGVVRAGSAARAGMVRQGGRGTSPWQPRRPRRPYAVPGTARSASPGRRSRSCGRKPIVASGGMDGDRCRTRVVRGRRPAAAGSTCRPRWVRRSPRGSRRRSRP